MPRIEQRYYCEHCNKRHYKHKSNCVAHEKKCFWNPVRKACVTCQYFELGIRCKIPCMNDDENVIKDLQSECVYYKEHVDEVIDV